MSIEKLREMGKDRYDLQELPKKLIATIINYEFKEDARGKECLFIHFLSEDDRRLTQKYSSMHLAELVDALEQLKVKDLSGLMRQKLVLEQKKFRIGSPRLFPVKFVQKKVG